MPEIVTHSKHFTSFNELTVTTGTNCPQGGDGGHGGRTILRLHGNGSTTWQVTIDGKEFDGPDHLEILLYGDAEARTFLNALEFAVKILRAQCGVDLEGRSESIR